MSAKTGEAAGAADRGPRMTKRRAETRQRLLDAAFEAFATEGFGRCTVEQICEQAGFTRGAFYSNFNSLEELFLAMWEQRSTQLRDEVSEVLAAESDAAHADPRQLVERFLSAVPLDDKWFRISSEFTAHALRNPSLREAMVAREHAISATLLPAVQTLLTRVGRRVTDPEALGRALIAVHDGTMVQCLMEPDNEALRRQRVDLFLHVLEVYTRPE